MNTGDGRSEHQLSPNGARRSPSPQAKWSLDALLPAGDFVAQVEHQSDQGRLLIVDDDPVVLRALQRMMKPRHDWSSTAVGGGEEALRQLSSRRFDVIIADVEMPFMTGSDLLGEVQERYPDVVRIHLSGSADPSMAMHAVPVAHQFLSKPLDIDHLYRVIDHAAALRRLLASQRLRRLVGASDDLPSAPTAYMTLNRCLADPASTFRDVAKVVGGDTSMCASILKLVNSAFFGSPKTVTNVTEAVSFLGIGRIRELVLTLGIIKMFEGTSALPGFSLGYLKRHALLTASICRNLDVGLHEDTVAMAAMLHELGQMLLASRKPEQYAEVLEGARRRPLHDVEREKLGATHAEVGAYLLGLWGLPAPIVEAVALHHDLDRSMEPGVSVLAALYVADHLAAELEGESALVFHERHGDIDELWLESLGVAHRLPEWRSMASRLSTREVHSPPQPTTTRSSTLKGNADGGTAAPVEADKGLVVGVMSPIAQLVSSCQRALEGSAQVCQVCYDIQSLKAVDLLVVPLALPLKVGLEAFTQLQRENPRLPMILAARGPEQDLAEALLQSGADAFVFLPFEPTALVEKLEKLATEHRHESPPPLHEVQQGRKQFEQEAAARNRRKCFRIKIPPEFPVRVSVRIGLTLVPLKVKDLSVVTDGKPGGILLCVDESAAQRLPLSYWRDGTSIPLRMELPDYGEPLWFEGRITGAYRVSDDGVLCFAVQYIPPRSDAGRIYRYWLEVQRRGRRASS